MSTSKTSKTSTDSNVASAKLSSTSASASATKANEIGSAGSKDDDLRDKYANTPALLPIGDYVTSKSLDALEYRASQMSFTEGLDMDAEKNMLKTLDNCVLESKSLDDVSYEIRPGLGERFRPMAVSEVMHSILYEHLTEKVYSLEDAKLWTVSISDSIRDRVKELFGRYKVMVQVVIGEHRGAGCVIACRFCWDSDTDALATSQFINDTIFASAMAFGVFYY